MPDKLITQQGRKVFKEVVPMVSEMILQHMAELDLKPDNLRRMWLHQANSNMNRLIAERVLGREATQDEAPLVLDTYGKHRRRRLDHRLPQFFERSRRRRQGTDLLVRRWVFGGLDFHPEVRLGL